jgi:hypothetical protein
MERDSCNEGELTTFFSFTRTTDSSRSFPPEFGLFRRLLLVGKLLLSV